VPTVTERRTKTIKTATLARVEGEGAMRVRIEAGEVTEVALNIYEPPRFFEAFLRGRDFAEAIDITSRICGICPVAYQMSAVTAMESLCGVEVGGQLRALRRLLYCGEWIESHALHIFMLHAPDFLGYAGAVEMARDHPTIVADALTLKKAGNEVMRVVGGREVHPINLCVGGLHRAPRKAELATLVEGLKRAREIALGAVTLTATLNFPDFEQDFELVALAQPGEYPIDRGRVVSDRGLDIAPADYMSHFVESHVPWSNALHSRRADGSTYVVGPLARFATSYDELRPLAREAAAGVGLRSPEKNPFRSIVVRAVELVHAVDEALALIDAYEEPDVSKLEVQPRAGVGHGVSEAPRGLLYHRYEIDEEGTILDAVIVPPTSQNQTAIESDLRGVVERSLDLPDAELSIRCEQTIRNYDPCISCATHFLKLEIERV
jgi:coenzyme F420-reducing hydrogenase alpha subunit